MKRTCLLVVLFACVAAAGFSEQITTVAVLDLSKVIQSFYASSTAVREYQKMKESAQVDIDRQNEMIRQLSERKLNASNSGDEASALALENEIFQKRQYLQEYVKIKNAQLQAKRATLTESSSFLSEVLQAVENVALAGGFSVVLDISDQKSNVLWYSKIVDITNDVIERLKKTAQ